MASVAQIWRHPIKGIGAEQLDGAALTAERPLLGDRAWAMGVGDTVDTGTWQRCLNFARGCQGPRLMAITARTLEDGRIHLEHPDTDPLAIDPATQGELLADWLRPLWPSERPAIAGLIKAPQEGMSDASYACLSILGSASLAALAEACEKPLDPRRFRGNLWVDGWEPWQELDLVGKRLAVGGAVLEVVERIDRCRATQVNPDTGEEDTNTLRTLRKHWGHIDFGVKAKVVESGQISTGAEVRIL